MADGNCCASCPSDAEDIIAVSWCSDCSKPVCKTCAGDHDRLSPPHKVVPIKEMKQLSSSLLSLSKNCQNHPDQANSMYCCQHDKVICVSCIPVSHHSCKYIITLEKAARGEKDGNAVSDLERRISDLCQVTENRRSHRETTLVDLEKSRTNIKKRVSEIKQKIIVHLDKLEADIHKDIDSKYEDCTELMSRNTYGNQSSSDSLYTWKSYLQSTKQNTSAIDLFQVVKFLDAKIYQKELEIREFQTATVPILKYHPSESETNIKKLDKHLGTITVENIQVPMPILDKDKQGHFLVRDDRKLLRLHAFETTKLGNEVVTYRGCFIPGNRLLLGGHNCKTLFVCAFDGSKSNEINLDYILQDISLYDNTRAVVSVGNEGIQIIDLTSLTPGRRIKVEGVCMGITSVNSKIWVRNKDKRLTSVDIEGTVLNIIQTTFSPRGIFADQDGDVYCTGMDRSQGKVYAVTLDGKEREIYNSPPDHKSCLSSVVVDNRGDVYVAEFKSSKIHRIYNYGQKQEIVLTTVDGINEPTCLSYNSKTKELLVLNDHGRSINIYKAQ